ncbi:sugar ABC transporter substrate-binding protein [Rhizobium sp. P38BS-XIX]|uniref:ABC transporter substrate-binding protein n=1 Tax=Rhizobium sp. P38BS-XIX TaxID=2726740 RepID=UPI001456480E|nr:sugar ABC transporter substrate-binding protein [Rhizobium sp. P38BS-XIX]NLR99944.1 sugar ABC transporter substrate-binding protein [Rhizobium sp. P38BS-XIX]
MLKRMLAATALLSICLSSAASADTISLWVRSGSGGGAFKAVIDQFNATSSDKLQLTEIPAEQMVQKYATAVAGGQAPDAIAIDLIYTPSFAATGQLQDMTDFAKSLPYFNSLSPAHVKQGTYEGKVYGLPLLVETSVFAWNKNLYKQAGLDPDKAPTSWEEITSNADKIRKIGGDDYGFYFSGGGCGGCMIFTFTPLVWGAGADILSQDGKTATLDTPQMRKAVGYYRSMVKSGAVPASAATDNGVDFLKFLGGKIGQQGLGAFAIGQLITQHPEINFGVTLIPGIDGKASSFAGGDNIIVTKGSSHVAQIQKFLQFVYSEQGQSILAKYGSLPTRTDIADKVLEGQDARLKIAASAIAIAKTPYTLQFNDLINSPNSPWSTFINSVMFGDDVDGSFKNAQSDMQSMLDSAQ